MRIILIIKSIINLAIGIVIIALRETILSYLSFVIAIALLLESVEDLIYVLVMKKYKSNKDALFNPLAITFVGIVLIVENIISSSPESNIEFVCIIWGTVSIYSACKDISEAIYHKENKKSLVLHLVKAVIALAFAFMLIINPLEHVLFHLVVLGLEFIAEAIELSFHWITYREPKVELNDHMKEELERIHTYIDTHPTMDEEIYKEIHKK